MATIGDSEADVDADTGLDAAVDIDAGIDLQAAVGLYAAIVAVGLAVLLAAAAGASSDAILGLVPTAFTGGLLCGAVFARVDPGPAVRHGSRRWRTVALWLPAAGIGGGAVVFYTRGAIAADWTVFLVGTAVAVGIAGGLLARSARDAYVGTAIDTGDPVAAWTWHQSGTHALMVAGGIALFAVGAAVTVVSGFERAPVRLFFFSALFVAVGWGPTLSIPTPGGERTVLSISAPEYDRAELRAYEPGLVLEPRFVPTYRRFVPWDRITDVGLTDEKLVLERRLRPAIRCDRSAIDDPEGVADALENARRAEPRRRGSGGFD